MGLFSKLKSMKNAVTGGAAKVYVEVEEGAELGEGFDITVKATTKASFDISSVYIVVRSYEEAFELTERGEVTNSLVGRMETFEQRFDVSGPESLKEGEEYEWEVEITLPDADCNPSFDGEMIRHTWEIMGALDAKGNDPDSGWATFIIE